jgi:ABC-type multidrug transport system ATPase subunit
VSTTLPATPTPRPSVRRHTDSSSVCPPLAYCRSLWGSVITSFGFLISQLFRQKRSVILLSLFYTLSIGFVANVVLVVFVEQGMNGVVIALQSLIPSFCAFRGLYELSSYAFLADQTNRPGLQWSMLRSDPGMLVVLIQLAVQSVVIPLLAIYTEREWLFSYGGGERSRAAGSTAVPKGRPTKQARQASKDDALDHYLGYIGGGMQFDSDDDGSTGSARQITRRASSMGYYFAGASGGGHLPLPSVEPTLRFGANLPNANDSQQPNGLDEDDNDGDGEPSLGPSVLYRGVRKAQPKSDISIPCLAVRDKEIFCFLADDPMCASTLLKMTGGFSCPDDGTILVRGKDSRELVGELRTRISIVFNGDILFEELTGMEHLQYYVRTRLGRLTDADASRYIQSAVEILELHSSIHKRVSSCSSGMRRRLSLAISLLGYPERGRLPDVLLMHEPTRSMDPYSRKVLWRALGSLRRKTAVVIATSSISEAESCDRVAVMKEGAPIFVGSPQHLIFARGRFIFLAFTVGAGDGQPGNSPSRKPPPRAHNKLPDATERTTRNADQVVSFVKQHIQGAELLHNWGGGPVVKLKFKVPLGRGAPTAGDDPYELGKHRETECFHAHQTHDHQPQTIDTVFRVVERARAANTIHILDYRVANCNLEDVYLDMVS